MQCRSEFIEVKIFKLFVEIDIFLKIPLKLFESSDV